MAKLYEAEEAALKKDPFYFGPPSLAARRPPPHLFRRWMLVERASQDSGDWHHTPEIEIRVTRLHIGALRFAGMCEAFPTSRSIFPLTGS